MKRFLLFLLCFCLTTMSLDLSAQKDWTMLVYLVGSDLESGSEAGSTDIQEMLDAGNTDFVNVIVLTGGADKDGWVDPIAWSVEDGELYELNFIPSGQYMSDSVNVTEFINYGIENFPADKVMLNFWNHGSDIRGFGWDEISGNHLSVPQLTGAIQASNYIQAGSKFEVIGFDACLMANIETQSSFKNFANYFIGSEEQEPGHGWNYTPIVQSMNDGNFLLGDQIGRVIVDGFRDQAIAEQTTAVTLGVIDLKHITNLETSLSNLFAKISAEGKIKTLQRARGKSEEYSKSIKDPEYSEDMVDVGDLMFNLLKLDESLATEINDVQAKLDSAVVYNVKDMARPKATGISIYLPHNVLVDEMETQSLLTKSYEPINFSNDIKQFVIADYVPTAHSDNEPPSGENDDDFNFYKIKKTSGNRAGDSISAIKIFNDDDLEQVQVVLVEEFVGFPNELILLGSSYPDTVAVNNDGSVTYAYKWDEHWLGINGYPAYISDIHDFEVEDENGNISYYTRIHIPAILHPDTEDETFIILAYRYDEDFNIELENIMPEVENQNGVMVVPKERIFLKPGDQVQLLYESFNTVTDEEFFVVDGDAIFTIENGNEDLMLEYDMLEEGTYHIGFVLEDHSQNDTLIFNDKVFTVLASATDDQFGNNNISVFPNPTDDLVTIDNVHYNIGEEYTIKIYDLTGRLWYTSTSDKQKVVISTKEFTSGVYNIELINGKKKYIERLVIQH
jgi:hypothetical protein